MKTKVRIYIEVTKDSRTTLSFDRIVRIRHIPRIGEDFRYTSSFLSDPKTKSKIIQGKVRRVFYDITKKEKITLIISTVVV